MKDKLLKWIYVVSYYLGLFELFFYLNKHRQVVITYHNIIPDDQFNSELIHLGVSCSHSAFVKQVSIIAKRFNVTTMIDRMKSSCIITFDDGYKNNYTLAAPVLDEVNLKGLFFIPACYFETETVLWVDKLLMWVSYVPHGSYEILSKEFHIINIDDRFRLWQFMFDSVLLHPKQINLINQLLEETQQNYPYDDLKKQINSTLYAIRFKSMSTDEMENLKNRGHKIGCHSFNHYVLSNLDLASLEADFIKCQKHIKEYNTLLYSYPFGGKQEVSEREMNLVQKHGYTGAFVNYNNNSTSHYQIDRLSLDNLKEKYAIEARLSGFDRFLKKLFWRL